MKESIEKALASALVDLSGDLTDEEISSLTHDSLERPKSVEHGDWTTNIAFVLAGKLHRSPQQIAEELGKILSSNLSEKEVKITVVGGYVNFTLSDRLVAEFIEEINELGDRFGANDSLLGKEVMIEYTDPNPFKVFHIGHLMPNVIGESLANLFEFCGAKVWRVNYQGDVGLHVAKSLWAMRRRQNELPDKNASLTEKTEFLGRCYAAGNRAYEENSEAREQIKEINRLVYERGDTRLMKLYELGRKWSLDHFEEIYRLLGTKFDEYFFESQTWPVGKEVVRKNIGKLFEESEGAVIFDGEKYNLHKRVFITAQGLTTYEAKDIGLAYLKRKYRDCDKFITVTGVEQKPYFQVVFKVLGLLDPYFAGRLEHISHGLMQLKTGKMSSRTGNVISGESLLYQARELARKKINQKFCEKADAQVVDDVAVAGVKFGILKQSLEKNVIYDPDKALSFEGDSGPYLQYTVARINSLLEKARSAGIQIETSSRDESLLAVERLLMIFPEKVSLAVEERAPHHVANYLTDLARAFNNYYAEHRILDSDRVSYRLAVAAAVGRTIRNGLRLLGIRSPEKM